MLRAPIAIACHGPVAGTSCSAYHVGHFPSLCGPGFVRLVRPLVRTRPRIERGLSKQGRCGAFLFDRLFVFAARPCLKLVRKIIRWKLELYETVYDTDGPLYGPYGPFVNPLLLCQPVASLATRCLFSLSFWYRVSWLKVQSEQ